MFKDDIAKPKTKPIAKKRANSQDRVYEQ